MRIFVLLLGVSATTLAVAADTPVSCLTKSGAAGVRCLAKWTKVVEKCRKTGDESCESDARAEGGKLEAIVSAIESSAEKRCDDDVAFTLGYLDEADVTLRLENACRDWGEDALAIADGADGADSKCQSAVVAQLRRLRTGVVGLVGRKCIVKEARGKRCDRSKRDGKLAILMTKTERKIDRKCGAGFDALGLGPLPELVATAATRARHFAVMAYPPNDVGPTGEFGPFPVGVRTESFVDASRMNVTMDGPRPVTTEIYYPSTEAAVAGVPNDVANVLGIDVAETPAFRDVDAATGSFPLIVFSHGNVGIRIQSVSFYTHLASHGYVVATPDHHGNTFVDAIPDPDVATNRPLDMGFLIDEMVRVAGEPEHPLAGIVDMDRIGATGHSFGGFTAFAMAGSGGPPGIAPDVRVKAIMPLAPSAPFDEAFFKSITVPTLIVGGTIDETTPFESDQRVPFEQMSAGGAFIGLAEVVNGGHFTFSEFCEVDRQLLAFLGGFEEACEPRHLPSRHARDRINYLALNFFDWALRDDVDALARLAPAVVNAIDDVILETK